MKNREEALEEIYTILYNNRVVLGLRGLQRNPTEPIEEKYLPVIFIVEDVDEIIKVLSRSAGIYPCKRRLEVILEMVADTSIDIKKLYRDVRNTLFSNGILTVGNTFIREVRTEGPTGYGLPKLLGMRLILEIVYDDDGN